MPPGLGQRSGNKIEQSPLGSCKLVSAECKQRAWVYVCTRVCVWRGGAEDRGENGLARQAGTGQTQAFDLLNSA